MTDRVVVVASACEYPDASRIDQLYKNVLEQRQSFRLIPRERFDWTDSDYNSGALKINAPYAALLKNYHFDYQKFQIPIRTYQVTDLTHWLALDVASRAIDDIDIPGGLRSLQFKTGVVMGNTLTGDISRANNLMLRWPFLKRVISENLTQLSTIEQAAVLDGIEETFKAKFPAPNEESLSGSLANTIAGRIANYYDFKGGGFSIDGACASSLLAIEHASNRLRSGQWDAVVCGGVDISLDPFELVGFSLAGALATNEMKLFDKKSNGFWPGEGCGVAILMRESTAKKFGLPVQAVIAGCGISSDGKGGMTRPTSDGQMSAISQALSQAGCKFSDLDFVECHGTGTVIGDGVELHALSTLAAANKTDIAIGSIKANIGHTKAAAGMAGFFKALSCLEHGVIPPTTGCHEPLDLLLDKKSRLEILDQPRAMAGSVNRAGVSSFGFGGINTHVVLERTREQGRVQNQSQANNQYVRKTLRDQHLFVFSSDSLEHLIDEVSACLKINPSFAELGAYSASLTRRCVPSPYRLCIISATPYELFSRVNKCLSYLSTRTTEDDNGSSKKISEGCFFGRNIVKKARLGFVYPGQAAAVNLENSWLFRLDPKNKQSLESNLADVDGSDWTSTWASQLSIIAVEVMATKVLLSAGIKPDAVLGHSVGEYAAWWAAGILSEPDLLTLVSDRGALMQRHTTSSERMMTVKAPVEVVQPELENGQLQIACYNSDQDIVVAGNLSELEVLQQRLRERNITTLILNAGGAFHTHFMTPARKEFSRYLDKANFSQPELTVVSSITGTELCPDKALKDLLLHQFDNPVQFGKAAETLSSESDLIIEIGPGAGLSRLMTTVNKVSTDVSQENLSPLLNVLAASFCSGIDVDFAVISLDEAAQTFSEAVKFIHNPCGLEQADQLSFVDERGKPIVDGNNDGTYDLTSIDSSDQPIIVLQKIVAAVTGLVDNLGAEKRFLADLHLNSLTVAEITNKFVSVLGKRLDVAPTAFSESSLKELVENVLAMPDTAGSSDIDPTIDKEWIGVYEELWSREVHPVGQQTTPTIKWPLLTNSSAALNFSFLDTTGQGGEKKCPINCLLIHIGSSGIDSTLFDKIKQALNNKACQKLLVLDSAGDTEGFFKSLHKEQLTTSTLYLSGEVTIINEHDLLCLFANTTSWRSLRTQKQQFFEPQLERIYLDESNLYQSKNFGVVVFTGGAKGIGLECACALLETQSVQTLCVVGSSEQKQSDTASGLARLEKYGINIEYYRCDLASESEVRTLAGSINNRYPQIHSLIHAAGINQPCTLSTLTYVDVQACIDVKTNSLNILLEEFSQTASLSSVIGFGSVIARYGLQGESHYALSNEKMWKIIESYGHSNQCCHALCLDWSLWEEVGMAESLGVVDQMKSEGIAPITVKNGVNLFKQFLEQTEGSKRYFVSSRWGKHATFPALEFKPRMLRFHESVPLYYPDIELVLDSKISELSDPYLLDHKISGQAVLPAVMILEICAQTVISLGAKFPHCFESVSFDHPVLISAGEDTTVRAHAIKQTKNNFEVSIYTSATDFKTVHACAKLSQADRKEQKYFNPIHQVTSAELDIEKLYGSLYFNHGRFQRIEKILCLHAGYVAAKILLRPEQWFGAFKVDGMLLGDPGARDACLHMIQACYPTRRLLPVSVQKIIIAESWGELDYVFVSATETASHEKSVVFDITIGDESGKILEEWQGIKFSTAGSLALSPELQWPLMSTDITRRIRNKLKIQAGNVIVTSDASKTVRKENAYQLLAIKGSLREMLEDCPAEAAKHGCSVSHSENYTLMAIADRAIGCDMEFFDQNHNMHELSNSLPSAIKELSLSMALHLAWGEKQRAMAAWVIYEAMFKADMLNEADSLKIDSNDNEEMYFSSGCLAGGVFFRAADNGQKIVFSIVVSMKE